MARNCRCKEAPYHAFYHVEMERQMCIRDRYEEMCSQVEAMGLPEVIAAYNAKLAEVDALVDQYAEK